MEACVLVPPHLNVALVVQVKLVVLIGPFDVVIPHALEAVFGLHRGLHLLLHGQVGPDWAVGGIIPKVLLMDVTVVAASRLPEIAYPAPEVRPVPAVGRLVPCWVAGDVGRILIVLVPHDLVLGWLG